MGDFNFANFVPFDRDFPALGEFTPVGVPPNVQIAIDTYDDVAGYFYTDIQSFLPVANPAHAYDIDHGWVSNGSTLTIPEAFEPLWRIRKMKLSWDFVLEDNDFSAGEGVDNPTPNRMTMRGSTILDTGLSTESDLAGFRGFKWSRTFTVGDMDFAKLESSAVVDGEVVITVIPNEDWTGIILSIDIGHIRSAAMEDESVAQVHSFLYAELNGESALRAVSLGRLAAFPDDDDDGPLYDTTGTLQIRMTGFHSHDLKLLGAEDMPITGGPLSGFLFSGHIKLEPATGETNAFWGYGGKYNTTTGAPI